MKKTLEEREIRIWEANKEEENWIGIVGYNNEKRDTNKKEVDRQHPPSSHRKLQTNKQRHTSEKKVEESQPTEISPRRKMLVKKLKAQQSLPSAHYSFVSTKAKKLFIEAIQSKQPIKGIH